MLSPLVDIEELIMYFKELRQAYPMIDGFWTNSVMNGTGSARTNVDRWEAIVQTGITSTASTENYIKNFVAMNAVQHATGSEKGEEYNEVLVDAVKRQPDSPPSHVSHRLRYQHDCRDCGMYRSLKDQSKFFLQNASASFSRVVSETEDEENHIHNRIEHVSFENFLKSFDNGTRLRHGILPKLKQEVKGIYLAWPKLLCEIECNMRKVMYSEHMYVAMRETPQNMDKNIAAYCSGVQDHEWEVAYKEIEDLRQEIKACEFEGKYMPSPCDLHRIQNALLSMVCQPVKAFYDLESKRATDQQLLIEEKTAQNDVLLVQVQAKRSELSKVKDRLDTSEAKLKQLNEQQKRRRGSRLRSRRAGTIRMSKLVSRRRAWRFVASLRRLELKVYCIDRHWRTTRS